MGRQRIIYKSNLILLSRQSREINIKDKTTFNTRANLSSHILIGNGCNIAENAKICGPSIIGDNCRIDNSAWIEKTMLSSKTQVGKNTHLNGCIICSDCVIGNGCNISEGYIVGDHVKMGEGCKTTPITKI